MTTPITVPVVDSASFRRIHHAIFAVASEPWCASPSARVIAPARSPQDA